MHSADGSGGIFTVPYSRSGSHRPRFAAVFVHRYCLHHSFVFIIYPFFAVVKGCAKPEIYVYASILCIYTECNV